MKKIVFITLILVSCSQEKQSAKTIPFRATLIGQQVSFPLNLGELLRTKNVRYVTDGQYKDSTATTRTIWYFDWHKVNWDSLGARNIPPQAPIYGVSFYLKNKSHSIDSVRQVIEDQFKVDMASLQVKHLNLHKEFLYSSDYPVFIATPSPGIYISLRQASCRKGDYPYPCGQWRSGLPPASDNPENRLRLAISFGLTPIEEERFALGDGRIWERKD
ncbi:hypothetical protein GCM10028807_48030 [Spirosoma daeguense]